MFRLDEGKDKPGSKPPAAAARATAKSETVASEIMESGLDSESVVIVEHSVNPYLVLFHDPKGFRAEQVRGLRNKLIAMNPDGSAKTLVVTSAIKGEGKSLTAINLAMAFAELEQTPVVLVDADMRLPSVENYLQLNKGPGLSDVLMGSSSLEQVIRPSGVRNLNVLGAGSRLMIPSEILTSTRIEELYARLKESYRYVIVDTPAVQPSTDASVLSSCADGTLMVLRLEHSSKSLTKESIRNIQDLGANILGVFVTEVRGADPETDSRLSYEAQQD